MSQFRDSVQLVIRSFRRFLSLSFIFAAMILTVRIYELVITCNFSNYPSGSTINLLIGFKYDLILYLRVCALLSIPYLIIAYFSQNIARYFFIVISLILVLGDMLLLMYFSTSRVPLGADLLGYSLAEIKQTVGASGELSVLPFIFIALFLALMAKIYYQHVYFRIKSWAIAVLAILMVVSILPIKQLNPRSSSFDDEFGMF